MRDFWVENNPLPLDQEKWKVLEIHASISHHPQSVHKQNQHRCQHQVMGSIHCPTTGQRTWSLHCRNWIIVLPSHSNCLIPLHAMSWTYICKFWPHDGQIYNSFHQRYCCLIAIFLHHIINNLLKTIIFTIFWQPIHFLPCFPTCFQKPIFSISLSALAAT